MMNQLIERNKMIFILYASSVLCLFYFLYYIGLFLILLAFSIYLMNIPVQWLHRLAPSLLWSRRIVFGIFLILLTLFFIFIPLPDEVFIKNFLNNIQQAMEALIQRLNQFSHRSTEALLGHIIDQFNRQMSVFLFSVLSFTTSLISNIFYFIFLLYYCLMDQEKIGQFIHRLLPKNNILLLQSWRAISKQMKNYVNSRMIEMLIVFIAVVALISMLQLPHIFLLSFIAACSILVPYIGFSIASIFIFLLVYNQYGEMYQEPMILAIVICTIINIADSYFISPLLYSKVMGFNTTTVVIGTFIFGKCFGIYGMIFSVPLLAIGKVLLDMLKKDLSSS